MKLYAEQSSYRSRQILIDALAVAWMALWIRVGMLVYSVVQELASPARLIEVAGSDFEKSLRGARVNIAEVPVLGEALARPFRRVEESTLLLQDAGQSMQDVVHDLAIWLGFMMALLPVLFVVLLWFPRRWRWIKEATAASRLRAGTNDLRLFALRALATRPLSELKRATPDPAGAYYSGDFDSLAALELKQLGLSRRPARSE